MTVVSGNRGTIKDEVARLRDSVLHQAGLMGALEATILSMANVHADRDQLRASLERSFELVESILLGESPSETTLRAFQQARARIARAIG